MSTCPLSHNNNNYTFRYSVPVVAYQLVNLEVTVYAVFQYALKYSIIAVSYQIEEVVEDEEELIEDVFGFLSDNLPMFSNCSVLEFEFKIKFLFKEF